MVTFFFFQLLFVFLVSHSWTTEERTSTTSTSHNGAVTGLTFTADGLFLLSVGTDSRMRLWDVFFHKNTLVPSHRDTSHLSSSHITQQRSLYVVSLTGELRQGKKRPHATSLLLCIGENRPNDSFSSTWQ